MNKRRSSVSSSNSLIVARQEVSAACVNIIVVIRGVNASARSVTAAPSMPPSKTPMSSFGQCIMFLESNRARQATPVSDLVFCESCSGSSNCFPPREAYECETEKGPGGTLDAENHGEKIISTNRSFAFLPA